MPKPLTIKRMPASSSTGWQIAIVVLFVGPMFALWYCWRWHVDLHTENSWLNLAIHGALIVVPLVCAALVMSPRIEFEQAEEISLGYVSAAAKWPQQWWMMFLMWPVPVFGVVALLHDVFTRYLVHPDMLSTSPEAAGAMMVVIFCLGMFYSTLVLGRSENESWLAPGGLRTSLSRFHEWGDLDHISQHGDWFAIYHRVNPNLPMVVIRVCDPEKRALLEKSLSEHHVRMTTGDTPQLMLVKIAVTIGSLALLGGAFWLRWHTTIPTLWIVLITFGAGIISTLALERVRGANKLSNYKPAMPVVPEDDWKRPDS